MGWLDDLGLAPEGLAQLPAEVSRAVAAFLVRWGYYADALPLLRRLTEDASDAHVSAWLVEALVGTASTREALRLADDLAARYPAEPEVQAARADALLAAGRQDAALACARLLLEADEPARALGLERVARCRLARGDLREAIAAAEQALAFTPPDATPAAPLRTLSQVLRGNLWKRDRQSEVSEQMAAAYEADLEQLRPRVAGPGAAGAPEGTAGRRAPCGAPRPLPDAAPTAPAARRPTESPTPAVGAAHRDRRAPAASGGARLTDRGHTQAERAGDGATLDPPPARRGGSHPTGPSAPVPAARRSGEASPPEPPGAGRPSDGETHRVLREVFGHGEFRPGQREVIDAVLAGQDTLAVFPTGGGKSLCYQLPAALLPGATVVISPLIALMKDQLEGLPPALAERATVVHSALELGEVDERLRGIAEGRYQLVFAAPERLRQWPFLDALRRARISLFVIDEAHCLSLWGHDFRPDYLFLGPTLCRLGNPPVLAMTATATPAVQEEIGRRLGRELRRVSLGVFRPNLRLEVIRAANDEEKLGLLVDLCRSERGTAIVYANARERCEDLARMLRGRRVQAQHYHAGMEREERASVQDAFMSGGIRVVVATVAFGMGVDKADVRMVVHYNLPRSLESYYQEAGRAGRDGQPSRCVLLATSGDRGNLTRWMAQERIPMALLRDTYRAVRQAAGQSRSVRIATDALLRAAGGDDETRLRVALSLLEQVGLLRRHMDLPRAITLRLLRSPEDPALQAVVEAARLRPGQSLSVDPLELAAAAGVPPGEIEGLLLTGQAGGWLTCWNTGREPLIEVPKPPADAVAALERLVTAHEEQQRLRLDHMVAYVSTRSCRHRAIAQHFGERAPRCPGCDNCSPDARGVRAVTDDGPRPASTGGSRPRIADASRKPQQRGAARTAGTSEDTSSPAALVVLQCVGSLPFAAGVKGLTNTLVGSLMAPIRRDRCPQHGALSEYPKARVERLIRALVTEEYLARDESIPQRPTLRLTDKGRQALDRGSPG